MTQSAWEPTAVFLRWLETASIPEKRQEAVQKRQRELRAKRDEAEAKRNRPLPEKKIEGEKP